MSEHSGPDAALEHSYVNAVMRHKEATKALDAAESVHQATSMTLADTRAALEESRRARIAGMLTRAGFEPEIGARPV